MGASASFAADAYQTALAFPNLFRRIFAEGAFAAAFVPAYAKSLAKDGEEVADVLAADAMAVLAAATIAITLVAQLTMPWLMYAISPGFAHEPAKFKLAVILTQISMPYLPCMAIYAHLSGVLNARGKFVFSSLAPSLLNIGMLIAILPQHTAQNAAMAASWGVLASGVAQVAMLWWGVRQTGAHVDIRLPRLTPDIKALISKAVPGAFAASATQINLFVTGFLASQISGGRTWLAFADRLYQLPLAMVGVAMGVALLPRLSRAVQADDRAGGQAAMDEAVGFSLAMTLPAAAALIAMPFFLIDGLFTRGEFHIYDAQMTGRVLFHYGWGVPAFVLQQLFTRAFFARGDTSTPMRFALVSVAVLRVAKLLIASLAVAVLLALASAYRFDIQNVFRRKEIAVAATVIWGAVIYVGLLFALQAVTPDEIRGALRRRPRPNEASPKAAR
jgi:putative peptidoglycan lipid II flippase